MPCGQDPSRATHWRRSAARCGSTVARSRRRCASRVPRWRRPAWSARPCRESPCDRACWEPNADRLRCRGDSRERLTGRMQDKGTDRGKKIRAICSCRGSARRTCGTRKAEDGRSTARRRCGRHACFIVGAASAGPSESQKSPTKVEIEKTLDPTYPHGPTGVTARLGNDSRTVVERVRLPCADSAQLRTLLSPENFSSPLLPNRRHEHRQHKHHGCC